MLVGRAISSHRGGSPVVELGDEPPLNGAGSSGPPDRRSISLRWLAGTVLTGLAGAALLGGAMRSTLQDGATFLEAPRWAHDNTRADDDRVSNGARKGDRLMAEAAAAPSARQSVRVSETTKHGDREIVKLRPFVRVSAPLADRPTEYASKVPAFDPLKVLASIPDRVAPEIESEGDYSFVVSDLASAPINADEGPLVPPLDVRTRVRETAAFEAAARLANQPRIEAGSQTRLAYAAEGASLAAAGPLQVDSLVRNMTLVAKSNAAQDAGRATPGETAIVVGSDGPLQTSLIRDAGVAPDDARAISEKFAGRDGYGVASVIKGQRLKVLMGRAAVPGVGRLQPVRVSLFDASGGHVGSVALSDLGLYVPVADLADFDEEPDAEDVAEEVERPGAPGRMRIYNGLYEAALRNQVPKAIIDEMVRIVSYDVDFNRPVRAGDGFEVFFCDPNEPGGDGEVAFLSLKLGGEQRRFYRFETEDDGLADYYDEAGKSAKKFLMRKPMNGGVMRSGFGFRRHPVLGYSKMHTGVDWAAPTGTPIVASGNGTVQKAGWENGYGRQVRVQHTNGYETTYNHMSGIARGVTEGARVRQGQVIGYVGSTGLSTGAHLHYEVLINGRFVNPMTIRLPRGRELDGEQLANFQRERERVDSLVVRGTTAAAKPSGAMASGG